MLLITLVCVSICLGVVSFASYQHDRIKFYKSYLADQQQRCNFVEKQNKELQEQVASLALKLALSGVQSVPLSKARTVDRVAVHVIN